MTSPRASQLTLRHRQNLLRLTGAAGRQTRSILARMDTSAVAEWWTAGAADQVEQVVAAAHRRAALLTVAYLQEHARLNDAEVDPISAPLDVQALRGSLFVVGVGAFLTSLRRYGSVQRARRLMTSGVVGSVHRFVLAGDRDTVMATLRAAR